MYYIYVLQSLKDNKFYTGCTDNLKRRFKEHNNGLVLSTKIRLPFKLVYYEASLSVRDARAREKYLKTGMGKRYIKNRIKDYLNSL
jgi:putative endonuclease